MMSRQEFFAWARNSTDLRYSIEQLYMAYESYLICPLVRVVVEEGVAAGGCSRCGNCCRRQWKVEASLNDVLRWVEEGRIDILESLEFHSGFNTMICDWGSGTWARQIAGKTSRYDERITVLALEIARATMISGGCVVPKEGICRYLIDGKTAACSIYETRPEVCRNFPEVPEEPNEARSCIR
ncbi:MAG TPA: YkgJ family cysteine cluster protein [Methanocella sp.]|nr:YkgJ family cysteine cluster protein [Methanocella sp.]